MEQYKNSQPSTYLLGDFNLNDPHMVCKRIPPQSNVFWGQALHDKSTQVSITVCTCNILYFIVDTIIQTRIKTSYIGSMN